MMHQYLPALQHGPEVVGIHLDAYRVGEKWSKSEIMVSGKIVNLRPSIDKVPEFMDRLEIFRTDSVGVFNPEIEKVSQDVK